MKKHIRIKTPKCKLRTYIFVVFLFISIVPLVVSNVVNYNQNRKAATEAAFKSRDQFISLASLEINDIIEQVEKVYMRLAVDKELEQKLREWPDSRLLTFQNMKTIENDILDPYIALYPYIDNIIIYPGNTEYAVVAGSAGFGLTKNYEEFSIYKSALQNPQRSFWKGPHEYEGSYYSYTLIDAISFIRAVETENNTFVIEIQIKKSTFDEKISMAQDGYDSTIVLKDLDNKVVSSNKSRDYQTQNCINKIVLLDNSWEFVYSIPKDSLKRTSCVQLNAMLKITAIYIIFVAFLVVITTTLISRPIKKVISRMKIPIDESSGEYKNSSYIKEVDYLIEAYENMRKRTRNSLHNLVEEQRKKQAAEMKVLQSQINPHFLYNSLNLIRCTAALNKQKDIEKMSQAIIQLLEFSINSQECVQINDEVEITRQYINLQECRHNKKMDIRISVEKGIGRKYMLKMIIIPLVENAIIHAYAGGENDVSVNISLYSEKEKLIIEVQDYGAGMSQQRINEIFEKNCGKFNRIGVKNIKERIQLYFGSDYSLSIKSKEGMGTLVRVEHPILGAKDWEEVHFKSYERNSNSG